jgi:DNA-binding MarR family transcriptional regulator
MCEMEDIKEKALDAWLQLLTAVNTERIVTNMTFNEAVVCNILNRNKEQVFTATELCNKMKMQKSLMNRTLTSMEEKGWISRIRSTLDKRQVFVKWNEQANAIYEKEHEAVLNLVDRILSKVGYEKANEVIQMFSLIASVAQGEIQ